MGLGLFFSLAQIQSNWLQQLGQNLINPKSTKEERGSLTKKKEKEKEKEEALIERDEVEREVVRELEATMRDNKQLFSISV